MEMRHNIQTAMEAVPECLDEIENTFQNIFGRRYGAIDALFCDDAEVIVVASGTAAATCRHVVQELRKQGERVGMMKVKRFRPFPLQQIRNILGKVPKVAVLDRNFSFGASGIFAQEIRAALCNMDTRPKVFGYIAGLGGRDITPELLKDIYLRTLTQEHPDQESTWIGVKEELIQS
jgi:pyruvate/2-oxoacid:ferredoxin oxidoreductase alpha subunit